MGRELVEELEGTRLDQGLHTLDLDCMVEVVEEVEEGVEQLLDRERQEDEHIAELQLEQQEEESSSSENRKTH